MQDFKDLLTVLFGASGAIGYLKAQMANLRDELREIKRRIRELEDK